MVVETGEMVREALKEVYDPEVGINIVDLGLVYGIDVDDAGVATITMTLTTPACPLGPMLESEVRNALVETVPGVTGANINLVWTPPWGPDKMSDDAKLELGFW